MYLPRAREVSGSKGYPWKEVVHWCEKQIGYKLLIVEKMIFFLRNTVKLSHYLLICSSNHLTLQLIY